MILNTTKSNTQILELVKENYEGCKTSMACVAWYKSKLRKEGKIEAGRSQKFQKEFSKEDLAKLAE
jgi:hypothetical protein